MGEFLGQRLRHDAVGAVLPSNFVAEADALAAQDQYSATTPLDRQAIDFLRSVWSGLPAGKLGLSALRHGERYSEQRWISAEDFSADENALSDPLGWAASQNKAGKSIYWNCASRKESVVGSARGTQANLMYVNAVWCDIDCDETHLNISLTEALALLDGALLPPTGDIFSGGGVQGVWCLDEPVDVSTKEKAEAFKALMRRFCSFLGANQDTLVYDATHMMRLPGFTNCKPERNGAVARVIRYEPDRVYSLEQIEAVAPKVIRTKTQPKTVKRSGSNSSADQAMVDRLIQELASAPEGTRDTTGNKAAFTLGGLVAAGRVDPDDVKQGIRNAALTAGLSEAEARKLSTRSVEEGMRNPLYYTAPGTNGRVRSVQLVNSLDVTPALAYDEQHPLPPADRQLVINCLHDGEAGDTNLFKDRIRYDHGHKKWLLWDGQAWVEDKTDKILSLTQAVKDQYLQLAGEISREQSTGATADPEFVLDDFEEEAKETEAPQDTEELAEKSSRLPKRGADLADAADWFRVNNPDLAWDDDGQTWRRWNGQFWEATIRQIELRTAAERALRDLDMGISSVSRTDGVIELAKSRCVRDFSPKSGVINFSNGVYHVSI